MNSNRRAIELCSFDLTKRYRFQENLEILSALKVRQEEFLNHISKYHQEDISLIVGSALLPHCADRIVLKSYPKSGKRFFTDGTICKCYTICAPCAFHRAYVTAMALTRFFLVQMKKKISLFVAYCINRYWKANTKI